MSQSTHISLSVRQPLNKVYMSKQSLEENGNHLYWFTHNRSISIRWTSGNRVACFHSGHQKRDKALTLFQVGVVFNPYIEHVLCTDLFSTKKVRSYGTHWCVSSNKRFHRFLFQWYTTHGNVPNYNFFQSSSLAGGSQS